MNTYLELLFLFIAAMIGGALNATISGGWFILFPALFYRGVAPVIASATTTLALWSGHVAVSNPVSKLCQISIRNFRFLLLACTLGGLSGAFLLVALPHSIFEHIGPLLLLGSLVLVIGYNYVFRRVGSTAEAQYPFRYSKWKMIPLFLVGVYGGYFGAGMGMMIFIFFRYYGIKNNDILERLATVLVSANNGMALIIYISTGLISWPFAIVVISGSIIGNCLGMAFGKNTNTSALRKIMIGTATLVTLYFLNLII